MNEDAVDTKKKRFKLGEKWKQKWSRKKAAMSGAAAAGLIAVSALAVAPTTAAWQDSESVGAEVSAGTFDLEISTNGGSDWQSGNGSTVNFTIPVDSSGGNQWGPGDRATNNDIKLRLSPDSTHNGVIQLNDCSTSSGASVRVAGSGSAVNSFNWRLQTLATGDMVDVTTTGLNSCSLSSLSNAQGRLVLDKDNQDGYGLEIGATARSNLAQGSSANFTIAFTAESMPNS